MDSLLKLEQEARALTTEPVGQRDGKLIDASDDSFGRTSVTNLSASLVNGYASADMERVAMCGVLIGSDSRTGPRECQPVKGANISVVTVG